VVLGVGGVIKLKSGETVFVGRADIPVKGAKTFRIGPLKDNRRVSNYALGIKKSEDGTIEFGPVKQVINNEPYRSNNEIRFKNTREKDQLCVDWHRSGIGIDISSITVQDRESKSGFVLLLTGSNEFTVSQVLDNGILQK